MKICVLHGYGQVPSDISKKIIRIFGKGHHYEFLEGDIPCASREDGSYSKRAWYTIKDISLLKESYVNYEDLDVNRVYNLYKDKLKDCDIIVGFSQGALISSLLIYYNLIQPKYIVAMSPTINNSLDHQFEYSNNDTNAILVYGEKDNLMDNNKSRDTYQKLFPCNTVIYHPHGHSIPSKAETRNAIRNLIQ